MRLFFLSLLMIVAARGGAGGSYLLQEPSYRTLQQVHTLLEGGDHAKARENLERLLHDSGLPRYDRAVALQTLGHLLQASGRAQGAIEAYREALGLDALPPDLVNQLEYRTGRLLTNQGAYAHGLRYLERWLGANPDPTGEELATVAYALLQDRQLERAGGLLKKAIGSQPEAPESWRLLLLRCRLAQGRDDDALEALLDLVGAYPDRSQYWYRLLWTYQQLDRPGDALALQELMHQRRMLDAVGLVRLARNYLHQGMPHRAARLLELEIASGSLAPDLQTRLLLADSWLAAREQERALALLAGAATESPDGEPSLKLGRLYFAQGAWPQAVDALQAALRKGSLQKPGRAWLLLAAAQQLDGSPDRASRSLQQACDSGDWDPEMDRWLAEFDASRMGSAPPIALDRCRDRKLSVGSRVTRRESPEMQASAIR